MQNLSFIAMEYHHTGADASIRLSAVIQACDAPKDFNKINDMLYVVKR